jgi:hypothetical protein
MHIVAILGTYLATQSVYDTWLWVRDTYSLFNLWNTMLNVLILLPAYSAYVWREKRLQTKE